MSAAKSGAINQMTASFYSSSWQNGRRQFQHRSNDGLFEMASFIAQSYQGTERTVHVRVCVRAWWGRGPLWFLNWMSGWDTWPMSWVKFNQQREHGVRLHHTPIVTAAPKHAGYLGSLRIHLWLKRCMQSQGRWEEAASCKTEQNKLSYCSTIHFIYINEIQNCVTVSIKELLIRTVIWVSCYALHPPLWDAVTRWASWKTT